MSVVSSKKSPGGAKTFLLERHCYLVKFRTKREEWLGFIFLAESWEGEIAAGNDEGSLIWVELERLLQACDDDEEKACRSEPPHVGGRSSLCSDGLR